MQCNVNGVRQIFFCLTELKEKNGALPCLFFGADAKPPKKLTSSMPKKALTKNTRCGRKIKRTWMISDDETIF